MAGFDRFEGFGRDELTAKHCCFRCSRPHDVDGIKIFDKDDQAAAYMNSVLWPGHLYQNSNPINIRRP